MYAQRNHLIYAQFALIHQILKLFRENVLVNMRLKNLTRLVTVQPAMYLAVHHAYLVIIFHALFVSILKLNLKMDVASVLQD